MGAGIIISENVPDPINRYAWFKPSTAEWFEMQPPADEWVKVSETTALNLAISIHAALPNVHHLANVGVSGSKVVSGYRLTFTNGLLTGFELV